MTKVHTEGWVKGARCFGSFPVSYQLMTVSFHRDDQSSLLRGTPLILHIKVVGFLLCFFFFKQVLACTVHAQKKGQCTSPRSDMHAHTYITLQEKKNAIFCKVSD